MKNILIILPWIPYPLKSGGNQAMFNGIQAIKNRYNVSLFCIDYLPWRRKSFLSVLKKELSGVKLHISWDYKIILDEIKRRILGRKFEYNYFNILSFRHYPRKILKKINQIIKQDHIDCIQIEMFDGLTIVEKLPLHIKKIFVHHELRFLLGQQITHMVKKQKAFQNKLSQEKNKEINLLNKFDAVITLSESDKLTLTENGLASKCFSSFAAICESRQYSTYSGAYTKKITFIGPEQHLPNKKGLLWFLEKCWTDIKQKDNAYSLHIIGIWNDKTQQSIKSEFNDVYFYGFVDDLAETLKGSVMIVPILTGSGIRMKILEAAQLGVPFVSTSIGNSGLLFRSEQDCLIADEPSTFTKSIFRMENESFRKKIVASAQDVFIANYSLKALTENRLKILEDVL